MQDAVLSKGYFLAIMRASQDVVRIVTLEGRVEYMNDRGMALLEITDFERNRGQLLADLWPAESHRKLNLALKRARDGQCPEFIAPCPTVRGRERWWSHIISPVVDELGQTVRLLVTSRDITGPRRREAKLKQAVRVAEAADAASAAHLANLRGAIEALPVGVALYDSDDRLLLWNAHYVTAGGSDDASSSLKIGRTFEELLRRSVASGANPEARGREEDWIRERLEQRAQACGSHEQRLCDGQWYRVEDRRLSHGGLVAIAVDITRHKDREAELSSHARELEEARAAAESASQAKSEFLANMSHEIRTPLNGVVGMADLLCRSNLGAKDREIAEIIRSSGSTLEHLLSDIIDIARIEAQQLNIEHEPFQLGDAVRATVALSRLKAEEKGIALRLDLDADLDRMFVGDVARVRQILTNLISNAVKFTLIGEVALSVQRPDGAVVRFAVTDTGIGFDPTLHDVFSRFQQADGSITRRFGGSGLGLTISKELAEKLGGSLSCTSRPGLGSSFWLDVPLEASVMDVAIAAPAEADTINRSLRILVADDHPTNLKVVELILEQIGAEVVTATNGAEAILAFRIQPFDLVLMDMQMPVIDGLAAVRGIRELEVAQNSQPVPVLMLTANALPEHVEAGRIAGANGHVAKPITSATLIGAISEAFEAVTELASIESEGVVTRYKS
ncbi:MAG: ATP-binding protein [Brevundimonas sp.]|uniref:ATP-binding protein n=1 Tax=Brevundimonas sp. TaxID=1871086 RepID=UPI002487569B|nr:ATP-binding protein [Brevundimonas sp.]MDI1326088.1 ATP-binding protein [Brevundimonas sp.]